MKHKFLIFALSAFFATGLFSCSSLDEPFSPAQKELNDSNLVEYSISVNIPDDMRTRYNPSAETFIEESGLVGFNPREINRLYYAVYYEGDLKEDTYLSRNNNEAFEIKLTYKESIDPSKLTLFFWACNGEDYYSFTSNSFSSIESLRINYKEKYVELNQSLFNNNFNFIDCFTKYIRFSDYSNDTSKATVSLKRPFVEFHILTDDFYQNELGNIEIEPKLGYKYNYSNTFAGFGNEIANSSNGSEQILLPTKWYYETDTVEYSTVSNVFYNSLQGSQPYRINFKDRVFDYLSCFHTFAPGKEYNKINLLILPIIPTSGKLGYYSYGNLVSIDLPSDGIKPNYKYIIYNKSREDGGNGFLSSQYTYDIIVDHEPSWEGSETSYNGVDKL